MKELNDLAKQIHQNAKDKGFWDSPRNTGEIFMLIISELSEALEAHRKGRRADVIYISKLESDGYTWEDSPISFNDAFLSKIKDTVEDELADAVIRILDFCFVREYDLEAILNMGSVMNCCNAKPTDNFGHNLMCISVTVGEAFLEQDKKSCGPLLGCAIKAIQSLEKHMGFDLIRHIELKMKYNATRERMHGKAY